MSSRLLVSPKIGIHYAFFVNLFQTHSRVMGLSGRWLWELFEMAKYSARCMYARIGEEQASFLLRFTNFREFPSSLSFRKKEEFFIVFNVFCAFVLSETDL